MEVPRKKFKAHNVYLAHFQVNNTVGHSAAQEEGLRLKPNRTFSVQVIFLQQMQGSLLPTCIKPKGGRYHFGPAGWCKATCS